MGAFNYYVRVYGGKGRVGVGSNKMQTYANRERDERSHIIFLIEHQVHKLLTMVTKFFFIKRFTFIKIRKQPFADVPQNRCS